ncbi:MAG: endopeptidase La [Candidatus Promineifilaceae bacterium]|nr:endopeptidase La [Candidatus Promineifilaceae bacterium]
MINETELSFVPIVPLRGGAVFPGLTTTISVGRRRSLAASQAALEQGGELLILVQYKADVENPDRNDLVSIGVLASIRDILRTPHAGVQILVELHKRVEFIELGQKEPYLTGSYREIVEVDDVVNEELINEALAYLEQYAEAMGEANQHAIVNARSKETNGELADYIAGMLNMPFDTELELLTGTDGTVRLEIVLDHLQQELRITEIRNKIRQDAREGADKAQREFLLREQMKAIRKELGQDGDGQPESLRDKIHNAGMPEKVKERALSELSRLDYQGPQSAEASVIRTYLEWLTELPWKIETEDNLDSNHVRQVLDEDHYGLDDVKDRIVEYVAVRKLAGNKMKGAIINLNGPPGVGKTSIATSVARAIGRQMIRLSLGGVRDEAEIRGHRRTYIGAIPGRIIRALRDAETRNPVIVLDEIDKVGADWRGDPSAALLEVLDPEQNHSFTDHYLEVPFDLSQVIFITTSNQLSTIPAPLLDRMETIDMLGYIEEEKLAIAEGYLLEKQMAGHGIEDVEISFEDGALIKLIRHYTREAGVRQLERNIGKVVRKLAVKIASGQEGPFVVTEADIETFLGPEKITFGVAEEKDEVGVATGLAVNAFGGDTLPIEVSISEGTGRITLTGLLGDVMRESAQAALTYARANARVLGLDPALFDNINVHIHVPDGATPKDGPSAGIGMATAVISALTRRPVRRDVAMTGEVTLRGKVLPIGGLKAKTIAAHRAGIKTVLIPKDNAKEIPDLPKRIREDLTLIPVSHLDEVLEVALLKAEGPPITVESGQKDETSVIIPPTVSSGGDRSIQASNK